MNQKIIDVSETTVTVSPHLSQTATIFCEIGNIQKYLGNIFVTPLTFFVLDNQIITPSKNFKIHVIPYLHTARKIGIFEAISS